MAGAAAMLAPRAQAVSLSIDAPVPVARGWMRAAGRYESGGAEPRFQVVARCGPGSSAVRVLHGIQVAPAEGALWLDLPGTADRLGPADVGCETPQLSLEMIVGSTVVASAVLPRRESGSTAPPPTTAPPEGALPLPQPQRRFHLDGQKYASPVGGRTEAGVALSVGPHMSLQLNYARTAHVPMMANANDNGILARLRFGF
jgi:hypothetical protein